LAQFNFKTQDKEITTYLESKSNYSAVIKDAIREKIQNDLNKDKPKEEKHPRVLVEVKGVTY